MNSNLSTSIVSGHLVNSRQMTNLQQVVTDTPKMKTFLVEDNATIRDNLISTLKELAPVESVGCAETAEEGANWLTSQQSRWDLAIVDLFLKSGSGLQVLQACRKRGSRQKMVVFSNYATREMRLRCAELGADAVFDKSTEIDALLIYCQSHTDNLAAQR